MTRTTRRKPPKAAGRVTIPPRTKTPGRAAQRAPRATLARAAATTPPEAVKRAHRTAQEPPKAAGNNTTPDENAEQSGAEGEEDVPDGYDLFVYAGPTLPRGRLKENAVFRGTFEDVKAYLADVLEVYPQVARLIVPVNRLAAFSVKVKTPGNLAHKYYSDIVSTMRGNREV